MKSKVTIQDIADSLGISRNTVSKAINHADGLSEATRERVLKRAMEMGYKQFSYAQTLSEVSKPPERETEQQEIALLTSRFLTNSHFASLMMDKFQQEISQFGYTLNTHRVTTEQIASRTLPVTLHPERLAAMVCVEMFDPAYDEMICGLGLPVLFIDGPAKLYGYSLPADQLYMDNTSGISRLVHQMLAAGHRRIGFIGDYTHCQSFYERYMAFRNTMMLAHELVDEALCIQSNDINAISDQLLALKTMPDLFLCANDFVAMDVLQILRVMNLQPPEDLGLAGFDDSAESRLITPSLTTVHIHTEIMAYSAVSLLLSRLRQPSLDYRVLYTESELILRKSTALPPKQEASP